MRSAQLWIVVVSLASGCRSWGCGEERAAPQVDAQVANKPAPPWKDVAKSLATMDSGEVANLFPNGDGLVRLGEGGATKDQRNVRAAYCVAAANLGAAKDLLTAALTTSGWQNVSLNLIDQSVGGTAQSGEFRMMVMVRGQDRSDCHRDQGKWLATLTIQKLSAPGGRAP